MRPATLVALSAVLLGVTLNGCGSTSGRHTARKRSAPSRSEASLRACVALWNRPGNSRQRALLNSAALAGPSVRPTTPAGAPPLAERALVLRYRGPVREDVGVGERGVDASPGDCLVAHPSNTLSLYTRGRWHQVGYSPGLAFQGIPQRAARAPNAVITLQKPGERQKVDPGRLALTG